MCNFFSFVSDTKKFYYFDWKIRKQILSGKLKYEHDSHTSIATHFGFKADKEDLLNKYEYNPLTKIFTVDQINNSVDDRIKAEEWVRKLDFKKIVPQLIIKPIVNPLTDIIAKEVTPKEILLLKKWNSVGDSVRNSVRNSVGNSVWDSVCDSVCNSVCDSVCDSVCNSVCNSVWDSVCNSVWDSVCNSVCNSVTRYFKIKFKFNFKCSVDLWSKGFVPSFYQGKWHLHAGKDAKVVFEISKEDLMKYK